MPSIENVIKEFQMPPLQKKILSYLQEHNNEVFSISDTRELANLINHKGSLRGISFSLTELDQKGLIQKERMGRRFYFGSKDAIAELRSRKK